MTDINKTSQAALGSKFFALQMEENKLERLQLQIAGLDALCDQLRARIAELEALCDETYVAKGADAYSHAVECMEEWRERRMREGKPPLYAAGLCDHLSLVRNYVESLEGERDALRARIAELERQPIRWRPISEAPKTAGAADRVRGLRRRDSNPQPSQNSKRPDRPL